MARFIKFNIMNASGDFSSSGNRYVNVDDIESVTDVVGGGSGYAVQVVLKGGMSADGIQVAYTGSGAADNAVPATTSEISARVLTLLVQNSSIIFAGANTNDPATITDKTRMPGEAIRRAMSANPGGVAASAQLNLDGNGISVAQGGTAIQMYWNSFVIANTSPAPGAE
tara:strand:+ start:269 stop:775 length:507 start_codon:yes stop_codon:yes gene_type:complete